MGKFLASPETIARLRLRARGVNLTYGTLEELFAVRALRKEDNIAYRAVETLVLAVAGDMENARESLGDYFGLLVPEHAKQKEDAADKAKTELEEMQDDLVQVMPRDTPATQHLLNKDGGSFFRSLKKVQ